MLEQGQNSSEARELAAQIQRLSGELNQNRSALAEAEQAANGLDDTLDDVGESARDAGDGFTVMKGAPNVPQTPAQMSVHFAISCSVSTNFARWLTASTLLSSSPSTELAKLGEKSEPIMTKVKQGFADVLNAIAALLDGADFSQLEASIEAGFAYFINGILLMYSTTWRIWQSARQSP